MPPAGRPVLYMVNPVKQKIRTSTSVPDGRPAIPMWARHKRIGVPWERQPTKACATSGFWPTGHWTLCSTAFQMEKWEAYVWLQAKLGLSESETHIGMFSEYMWTGPLRFVTRH